MGWEGKRDEFDVMEFKWVGWDSVGNTLRFHDVGWDCILEGVG